VHINRELRERGLVTVRMELGRELLDPGASAAFAVADHQVAHIYVNDLARLLEVRSVVEAIPGVGRMYGTDNKGEIHMDHPRAGELVALAELDAWFTYYYWMEESRAPDFAPTVDIHRKPGYDPVELFIDPKLFAAPARIGWTLLKRKLGFRSLLNVIGTDASLVRGSHGLAPTSTASGPVLISDSQIVQKEMFDATEVRDLILRALDVSPHPGAWSLERPRSPASSLRH